ILQKRLGVGKKDIADDMVSHIVEGWLNESQEIAEEYYPPILNAVLLHSGFNMPPTADAFSDAVLVALQDADRIVCSQASAIMEHAQFWRELPSLDPQDLACHPPYPF